MTREIIDAANALRWSQRGARQLGPDLAQTPGIDEMPVAEYCCSPTSELTTQAQAEGVDAERVSLSQGATSSPRWAGSRRWQMLGSGSRGTIMS